MRLPRCHADITYQPVAGASDEREAPLAALALRKGSRLRSRGAVDLGWALPPLPLTN